MRGYPIAKLIVDSAELDIFGLLPVFRTPG